MGRKVEEITSVSEAEVIRMAMKSRGMLQIDLADKLGVKQSSISGNVNRKKMGLDVFRTMLEAMDYDVVVMDRNTGKAVWKVSK